MIRREMEYLDVKILSEYKANARTHSDTQIQQIEDSISEFGFTNPLLVDENYQIIAGHGRLMAAKKMGLEAVPCVVVDGLTDIQKKALVIADNKLALNAGWDDDLLVSELQSLKEEDYNLDLTGFAEDELADLLHTDILEDYPELSDSDKEFEQKTFTLTIDQAQTVGAAIKKAKQTDGAGDEGGNSNGNALALICEVFLNA